MGSKFENFDIGRAVAKFLNIKGIKNFPTELNTDEVHASLDVWNMMNSAQPLNGEGQVCIDDGTLTSLATVATNKVWLISDQAADNARFSRLPLVSAASPLPEAWRFDTLMVWLQFDAAGATAYNGKQVGMRVQYEDTNGDGSRWIAAVAMWPWCTVATGRLDYFWSMNGGATGLGTHVSSWQGRVPANLGLSTGRLGLSVVVTSLDGTNFPANTAFKTKGMARVSTNGIVPDIGA